jgi:hypothetical protein
LTEDQLMPVLRELLPALLQILGQPEVSVVHFRRQSKDLAAPALSKSLFVPTFSPSEILADSGIREITRLPSHPS